MTDGFYKQNIRVALATKHGKERAISRPLRAGLGFRLVVPEQIETDAFGTFTGEIERPGNALETALAKARLGMNLTGLSLGLASEGRFGAHPTQRFVVGDFEWLVFVDQEHGFYVYEQITTTQTNFAHIRVSSFNDLKEFLSEARFPSHAVVARPIPAAANQALFIKGCNLLNHSKKPSIFAKTFHWTKWFWSKQICARI